MRLKLVIDDKTLFEFCADLNPTDLTLLFKKPERKRRDYESQLRDRDAQHENTQGKDEQSEPRPTVLEDFFTSFGAGIQSKVDKIYDAFVDSVTEQ